MTDIKKIATLALFMAVNIVLNALYIPVTDSLRITFAFVVMMMVAIIYDFKTCLVYAFIEDILAYVVYPTGAFFFGYTLGAMVSMAIYSLCLFKKVTVKRIITARFLVSIINNILLNSIWNTVLLSKGFVFYVTASIPKNLILLPFEIIIFIIFYRLIKPILERYDLIKRSS